MKKLFILFLVSLPVFFSVLSDPVRAGQAAGGEKIIEILRSVHKKMWNAQYIEPFSPAPLNDSLLPPPGCKLKNRSKYGDASSLNHLLSEWIK